MFADVKVDDRGLPGWVAGQKEDQDEILYTEEILAMIFAHGKFLADK